MSTFRQPVDPAAIYPRNTPKRDNTDAAGTTSVIINNSGITGTLETRVLSSTMILVTADLSGTSVARSFELSVAKPYLGPADVYDFTRALDQTVPMVCGFDVNGVALMGALTFYIDSCVLKCVVSLPAGTDFDSQFVRQCQALIIIDPNKGQCVL